MTERESIWVDLRPLSTVREQCLTLQTGKIDPEMIRQAEVNRFDQLPVLDDSDRLCGLIATDRARSLLDAGDELDPVVHELDFCTITPQIELFDLLSALGRHRAVVFRQDTGEESQVDDWFALVTISDLNRHPFRSYLYPLFARLESALAELIDSSFKDPWTWIPWTSKHAQPTIVGRWEMDKRESIDTTPLSGCELRDLMAVVGQSILL